VFFLVVQERESVKPDSAVGDATFTKALSNGFRDTDNNLRGSQLCGLVKTGDNSP
jgi:hypothetical protein